MKALCKNCFSAVEFRNQRGNKLSDIGCPCCGLRMLTRASFALYVKDFNNVGKFEEIYKVKDNLYKLDRVNNKFTPYSL